MKGKNPADWPQEKKHRRERTDQANQDLISYKDKRFLTGDEWSIFRVFLEERADRCSWTEISAKCVLKIQCPYYSHWVRFVSTFSVDAARASVKWWNTFESFSWSKFAMFRIIFGILKFPSE